MAKDHGAPEGAAVRAHPRADGGGARLGRALRRLLAGLLQRGAPDLHRPARQRAICGGSGWSAPTARRRRSGTPSTSQLPAALYRVALSSFTNQYVSVDSAGDQRGERRALAARRRLGDLHAQGLERRRAPERRRREPPGPRRPLPERPGPAPASRSSPPPPTAGPSERFIVHKIGGSGGPRSSPATRSPSRPAPAATSAPTSRGAARIRALRFVPGPAETFRYVAQEE